MSRRDWTDWNGNGHSNWQAPNLVDVLFSLVDVTERWNDLILNPLYVRRVDLTCVRVTPSDEWIYPITDDHVVERLCQSVLPRINNQVKELRVDQYSLGRVFHATSYPQLESLALIDIDDQFYFKFMEGKLFLLRILFTGGFNCCLSFVADAILIKYLNKQITCLIIDMNGKSSAEASRDYLSLMFALTLYMCHRITKVHFCRYFHRSTSRVLRLSSWSAESSTLTELKIKVESYDECLYLFDGRFPSLSTSIIVVQTITETSRKEENADELLKLKHFSLTSCAGTFHYDALIVPFLRRLINRRRTNIIFDNHPNRFGSHWWHSIARRDSFFDATFEQIYFQSRDIHSEAEKHCSLIQWTDSTQLRPTRISISWLISRDILSSRRNSRSCRFTSISLLQ